MMNIDFSKLTTLDSMQGDSTQDTQLLKQMFQEASAFLHQFDWCLDISKAFFGFGIGGVVAVFLFNIKPSADEVDSWLWVIVGDLPPAYIVLDQSPTPEAALRNYVEEMRLWIEAVRTGGDLQACIPVNIDPTIEHAASLESRLRFLNDRIFGE
jgi:hypothetical protein